MKTILKTSFFIILIFGFLLAGGCKQKEPVATCNQKIEAVKVAKPKPAHFIICIDNSKSIKPPEQVMIRETAMLLTDLVEFGDRVSVVTFGKDAGIVASARINVDGDRKRLKEEIGKGVDFKENYSDIRAGLRLIVKNPDPSLLDENFTNHIVLLSDGKLEPADKKVREAFNELVDLKGQLAGIDVYALVLGDTHCHDKILTLPNDQELNGILLMKNYIASASDTFFHAKKLDQLLPITVDIFKKSKGINAIGKEAEANKFLVDNTVKTMTLIIRKRSIDGEILCQSSDIKLNQPTISSTHNEQSIYRSNEYQYFDLIVVRKPIEGRWSVTLKNNKMPEILCKIDTPVELQYSVGKKYYINETSMINAWMFNRDKSSIIKSDDFRLKAHLSKPGELGKSNAYMDFSKDPETGQFYINVPQGFFNTLKTEKSPQKVNLEIISQRIKAGSTEMDPWFLRRSPEFTIDLLKPFINWIQPAEHLIKLPFVSKILNFGAEMDYNSGTSPIFETPPGLKFTLEYYDEGESLYVNKINNKIKGSPDSTNLKFQQKILLNNLEPGNYRYSYQLVDGILKDGGSYTIKSPSFSFAVKSYSYNSWEFWMACAILVLVLMCFLSKLTAKMQGTISTDGKSQTLYTKKFVSEPVYKNRFELKACKICFIKSYITLTVTSGFIRVDNQMVPQGQKMKLYPAKAYTLQQDEGNKKIERKLMVIV